MNPFAQLGGWLENPYAVDQICAMLPTPRWQTAGPDTTKDAMNHLLFRQVTGRWQTQWPQAIGDCVSFGFARLADYNQILDMFFDTNPDVDSDFEEACTESIYGGSRVQIGGQHDWSDGSVGAWAAKWLRDYGVISRPHLQRLGEEPKYTGQRAKNWGYYGVPDALIPEVRKLPFADVTMVTNFNDAAAHIQSGRVIAVCSNVGFENGRNGNTVRDAQGFAVARGNWNHCMTLTSVKFGGRPGALCENQWPPEMVTGPMGDVEIPPCSWWVDAATVDRMLGQKDSWTGSKYKSYPVRKMTLKH